MQGPEQEQQARDVYYRKEKWICQSGHGTDWAVYVDGERVATTLTRWGARRLCRKYAAGGPLPGEVDAEVARERRDF
jgi:hypothetical protein